MQLARNMQNGHPTLKKKASANFTGADNLQSLNRDSNSPTPQRNGKGLVLSGGLKLSNQMKSITGVINKRGVNAADRDMQQIDN